MAFEVTHREPLHKSGNRQNACGPTALSALTGYTSEAASAWINHHRKVPRYYQVRGSYTYELRRAVKDLGCSLDRVLNWHVKEAPTVRRFIESLTTGDAERKKLWGRPLLLVAGHHYFAAFQGKIVDSGASASQGGIPANQYGQRRAKVLSVHILSRVDKLRKREPIPQERPRSELYRRGRSW